MGRQEFSLCELRTITHPQNKSSVISVPPAFTLACISFYFIQTWGVSHMEPGQIPALPRHNVLISHGKCLLLNFFLSQSINQSINKDTESPPSPSNFNLTLDYSQGTKSSGVKYGLSWMRTWQSSSWEHSLADGKWRVPELTSDLPKRSMSWWPTLD